MKDINESSLDISVIPAAALARVSGGAGEWAAYTGSTKDRLRSSFESPTPELKEVMCGIAALREGKKLKNDDGTLRTPADQVAAARGTRVLCRKLPELPIDDVIP